MRPFLKRLSINSPSDSSKVGLPGLFAETYECWVFADLKCRSISTLFALLTGFRYTPGSFTGNHSSVALKNHAASKAIEAR